MTKAELIVKIAQEAGITHAEARTAVEAMIENIVKTVRKGEKVSISGFGTFASTSRNGRACKGRKASEQKPYRAPKFTPGKPLRESVRQSQ